MKPKVTKNLFLLIGLAGYLFIFFITLCHRQAPLFDEVLFISNVYLVEDKGFSKEFLITMEDQAPGPLYQMIHYPLRSLTKLDAPGVRLVNVVLLGLMMALLVRIFRGLKPGVGRNDLYAAAFSFMGIPMIWQVSGLALTEIPAMFFGVLTLLFVMLAIHIEERSPQISAVYALLAGLAAGLAILGRSPFLMLIPASFAVLFGNLRNVHRWRTVLLLSIVALGLSVPVFGVWGGLVPPRQRFVEEGGIHIWHGILAFAYGGLFVLILAPRWFYFGKWMLVVLPVFYSLFLVLNIYVTDYKYYSLSEVLRKIFPPFLMEWYPYAISPALSTLALYFIGSSFYRGWQRRKEPLFLFSLCCGLLILATTFKVMHLFSTRYVAQAAPFLLLATDGYDRVTWQRAVRLLIGMLIGFLSMETYFNFQ